MISNLPTNFKFIFKFKVSDRIISIFIRWEVAIKRCLYFKILTIGFFLFKSYRKESRKIREACIGSSSSPPDCPILPCISPIYLNIVNIFTFFIKIFWFKIKVAILSNKPKTIINILRTQLSFPLSINIEIIL